MSRGNETTAGVLALTVIGLSGCAAAPEGQDTLGLDSSGPVSTDSETGWTISAVQTTPPTEVAPPVQAMDVACGPVLGGFSSGQAAAAVRMAGETRVSIQYGTDPNLEMAVLETDEVSVTADSDYTAQLRLTELPDGSVIHYRVLSDGQPRSAIRHFKTPPGLDEVVDLKFVVLADTRSTQQPGLPAYTSASDERPDIVLQIGDLDHRDPAGIKPVELENWRAMHRDQLCEFSQGEQLDELILSQAGFVHTWDDHDYGFNNADGSVEWKSMAQQAFYEYFPMPADQPNPEAGIWYSMRWGQSEFFVTDGRSQRCTEGDIADEDRSMLDCWNISNGQYDWLINGLAESTAIWKFLITGSVWNPDSKQRDSWALFETERQAILEHIENRGITGVIILSADIHSGGGIDDGSHSGVPELSVPTTSMGADNCTGTDGCGDWSEGIWAGNEPAGYAVIEVGTDAESGLHRVLLQTKSQYGVQRFELSIVEPD